MHNSISNISKYFTGRIIIEPKYVQNRQYIVSQYCIL